MDGYDRLSRPDESTEVLMGLHLISMNYLVLINYLLFLHSYNGKLYLFMGT